MRGPQPTSRGWAAWLVVSNLGLAATWFYAGSVAVSGECDADALLRAASVAILVTTLEFFHALLGITRSGPGNVALFTVARAIIGVVIGARLPCHPAFVATVLAWSCGEIVRFTCFSLTALTTLSASWDRFAAARLRAVRYNAGPVFFSIGTCGEIVMLVLAATSSTSGSTWWTWALVVGWPAGFFILMRQLLKQRRKHLRKAD